MNRIKILLFIVTFTAAPYVFLKIGGINFTLFDILFILLALLYVFKNYNLTGNYRYYYFFSLCFLLFSWLSIYKSLDMNEAINTTVQYSFILLLLFPTVGKILNFDLFKKTILVMSFVWGLFTIANLPLLKNPDFLWGGNGGRFISLFSEPGELGLLTAAMTPFLLYSFFYYIEKKGLKWLALKAIISVSIIANIGALLASGSRSGLVSLIVGLALLFIMRYGISFKLITTSIIFIILSLSITSTLSAERNALTRLNTSENVDTRLGDYELTFYMLSDYFLLGTGLGTSGLAILENGGGHRPHNFFFDIMLETGAISLISIIVILGLSLFFGVKILWNVLINKKKANFLVSATFASGLIAMICQQFTTISSHRGYWLFWAFCLWMSTQSKHFYLENNISKESRKTRKKIRIRWQ